MVGNNSEKCDAIYIGEYYFGEGRYRRTVCLYFNEQQSITCPLISNNFSSKEHTLASRRYYIYYLYSVSEQIAIIIAKVLLWSSERLLENR